jgi:hypothetical protein
VDGKTLKGIGTRVSKSRLSGVAAFFLESSRTVTGTVQEEYKKELLWLREDRRRKFRGELGGTKAPACKKETERVRIRIAMEAGSEDEARWTE